MNKPLNPWVIINSSTDYYSMCVFCRREYRGEKYMCFPHFKILASDRNLALSVYTEKFKGDSYKKTVITKFRDFLHLALGG